MRVDIGRRVGGGLGGVGLGGVIYEFLYTFTVRCLRKRWVTGINAPDKDGQQDQYGDQNWPLLLALVGVCGGCHHGHLLGELCKALLHALQ